MKLSTEEKATFDRGDALFEDRHEAQVEQRHAYSGAAGIRDEKDEALSRNVVSLIRSEVEGADSHPAVQDLPARWGRQGCGISDDPRTSRGGCNMGKVPRSR